MYLQTTSDLRSHENLRTKPAASQLPGRCNLGECIHTACPTEGALKALQNHADGILGSKFRVPGSDFHDGNMTFFFCFKRICTWRMGPQGSHTHQDCLESFGRLDNPCHCSNQSHWYFKELPCFNQNTGWKRKTYCWREAYILNLNVLDIWGDR